MGGLGSVMWLVVEGWYIWAKPDLLIIGEGRSYHGSGLGIYIEYIFVYNFLEVFGNLGIMFTKDI